MPKNRQPSESAIDAGPDGLQVAIMLVLGVLYGQARGDR
jgi:hypothetical protein